MEHFRYIPSNDIVAVDERGKLSSYKAISSEIKNEMI